VKATKALVPGTVEYRDVLGEYATYLLSLVDLTGLRHLKVVVDAGNGMGGLIGDSRQLVTLFYGRR